MKSENILPYGEESPERHQLIEKMHSLRHEGEAYNDRKLFDAAAIMYSKAAEIAKELSVKERGFKDYEGSYLMKASSLMFELKKYDEAAQYAKSAADMLAKGENFYYKNARIFQGVSLYNLGREKNNKQYYLEAAECFDEIINDKDAGDDDKTRALKNKGNVFSLLGEYEQALQFYEEAIKLYPENAAAFVNKGNAYYGLKNYKEAEKCYECASRLLKGAMEIENKEVVQAVTHLHLALSKYNNGHTNEAMEVLNGDELNDTKLTSDLKASKYNAIGLCYYRRGLFEKAEQIYREALDNNYNLIHAHYNLAAIYASQNDIDKASRCIENCLRINKNFQPAGNAKKKLESSRKIDWMSWFDFSQRVRQVVGMTLIILMVIELASIIYLLTGKALTSDALKGLVSALGITLVLLILPNVKTIEIEKFLKIETDLTVKELAVDLEVQMPMTGYYGMK